MSERITAADFHIHTRESIIRVGNKIITEGVLSSPHDVVCRASEVGLSCIAITDHNTLEGISEAKEAGAEYGVKVISGIEISTEEGGRTPHVLGLGLNPRIKNIPYYRPALEVMDWVKDRGGFVVIPHPSNSPGPFSFGVDEVKRLRPLIDGLEVCNWWKGLDGRMVRLAKSLGLVMTGGSDSHVLGTIGLVQSPFNPEEYDGGNPLNAIPKDRFPKRSDNKISYVKALPDLISFAARLVVNTKGNPFIG